MRSGLLSRSFAPSQRLRTMSFRAAGVLALSIPALGQSPDDARWQRFPNGPNGSIQTVASFGPDIVVGGFFSQIGTTPIAAVARYDGSGFGTLDGGLLGGRGGGAASVLALLPTGTTLAVGGSFESAGGQSANGAASWNGTAWSPWVFGGFADRISSLCNYNGSVVSSGVFSSPSTGQFIGRWNGSAWVPLGSDPTSSGLGDVALAQRVFGGELIAGGFFQSAGGSTAIRYIARWNGAGWLSLAGGLNGNVYALAEYHGELIAGGAFTQAGGTPVSRIARWNGTGWSALGAGVNGDVYALAVLHDRLFVGGEFTTAGGTPSSQVAQWNGSTWGPLGSGTATGGVAFAAGARAFAVRGDQLIVGGAFTVAGGQNSLRLAIWNDPVPNLAPLADAGADLSVNEGDLVALDGSASHDPESTPLGYGWSQIAGTPVALDSADPVHPSFTAPQVSLGGDTLTFLLTVSDGEASSSDVVNVAVHNVNHPPVAIAAEALPVLEGSIVTLDGTQSWDPDNDPLSHSWIGPAGITLVDEDSATPWFVAPEVGQAGAELEFMLVVSDGLETAVDFTTVRVENIDHAPIAIAGSDQTRDEGTTISLDGRASFDPDTGDLLTPSWIQVSGPSVTLSDPSAWTPSFFAPLGTGGQDAVLELFVYDGVLYSTPSVVTVHLLVVNAPPDCSNAIASPSLLWGPDHKLVPVAIVGVSDPDGNPVTIEITGVTQDEPVSGSGSGDTGPDAVLSGGQLYLRAERSASGNGRVYEIHFTARDGLGATCAGSVRVSVPKNKKQDMALDSGQSYSSFGP